VLRPDSEFDARGLPLTGYARISVLTLASARRHPTGRAEVAPIDGRGPGGDRYRFGCLGARLARGGDMKREAELTGGVAIVFRNKEKLGETFMQHAATGPGNVRVARSIFNSGGTAEIRAPAAEPT